MTCPSWDDAVAIHPGESLALVTIERQVHVLRAGPPSRRTCYNRLVGVASTARFALASSVLAERPFFLT
jgi:hypothetical protein